MSVALVTGAGRGVGRVVAVALAEAGHDVAVTSRTASELAETAAMIEAAGRRALVHVADVTDETAVRSLAEAVASTLGEVDVLVNNAGTAAAIGPAWEVDIDLWWRDVESSLRSAFLCSHAVIPSMIRRRKGRIVNVSSYVAVRPSPYLSAYAAAKAAVGSFSEGLAAALGGHGIYVFTITPGLFRSELTAHLMESDAGRRWLPDVGTGRFVEPERLKRLVTFVVSDAAAPFSGRFLHALDDLGDLVAQSSEIVSRDLFTVRLQR
ncbi:MAG TPA: SDR family oxidoreductase [Gaiellaceae bacterium]|jgi:3-oxoacyl-[acyl-carrier protein] reductase|nr:SDR family oxidoreductase [Gaiellaceae bacterium]